MPSIEREKVPDASTSTSRVFSATTRTSRSSRILLAFPDLARTVQGFPTPIYRNDGSPGLHEAKQSPRIGRGSVRAWSRKER